MRKVKKQIRKDTERGDNAILRAVSGQDDIINCGIGIVSSHEEIKAQNRREKDIIELEGKYRNVASSIYDGTDFEQLKDEQKETEKTTTLKFLKDMFFAVDVFGRVKITQTDKCYIVSEEGSQTYVFGGENITLSDKSAELPPDVNFTDSGTLIIERNGCVLGLAFVSNKGKSVHIFKADKKIWLAKVVPIGSTPATLEL